MKKLKLRGRELEKLGFTSDEIISFIINLARENYKQNEKAEVLDILKKIADDPDSCKDHPVFEALGEKFRPKTKPAIRPSEIKLNTVVPEYVVYGREFIEAEALTQMETAMQLPVTVAGALMPDAHSGYGLPIGGVLATENAVIPYGVGMDIGCRMCLSVFDLPPAFLDNNNERLKKILRENTRFGKAEFSGRQEHEIMDRREFNEIRVLRDLKDKASRQLGTSGSGNHFVEFGLVNLPENNDWNVTPGIYMGVLSHSGSRHLGAGIARYYTQVAKEKCRLPKGAVNLAWLDLDKEEGDEYWRAMTIAGDYAAANHHIIHKKMGEALGEKPMITIENHHNFAWKEKLDDGRTVIVHRKGATPANSSVMGIIPGSMTLPGFIIKGKGNKLSLNSASHGAGRQMSRSRARSFFTPKVLKQELAKAGVELIGGGPDEAPGAYKDIYKVMEHQRDLVEIAGTFHPKLVIMDRS